VRGDLQAGGAHGFGQAGGFAVDDIARSKAGTTCGQESNPKSMTTR
jgi:hypothetical protein